MERATIFGECLRLALSGWQFRVGDDWLVDAIAWTRPAPFVGRGAEITRLGDRAALTIRPLREDGAGSGSSTWVAGMVPPATPNAGVLIATPYDAMSREFGFVGGGDTTRARQPVFLATGSAGSEGLWEQRRPAFRVAAPFTVLTYHRSPAHMKRLRQWLADGPDRAAPCTVHTLPSRHQWSRFTEFWTTVSDGFGNWSATPAQAAALLTLFGMPDE